MDESGVLDRELWESSVACACSTEVSEKRTFDANIVAVTLRQSLQWQTWVLTRPSPSTGCLVSVHLVDDTGEYQSENGGTHDLKLNSAAVTSCRCSLRHD